MDGTDRGNTTSTTTSSQPRKGVERRGLGSEKKTKAAGTTWKAKKREKRACATILWIFSREEMREGKAACCLFDYVRADAAYVATA